MLGLLLIFFHVLPQFLCQMWELKTSIMPGMLCRESAENSVFPFGELVERTIRLEQVEEAFMVLWWAFKASTPLSLPWSCWESCETFFSQFFPLCHNVLNTDHLWHKDFFVSNVKNSSPRYWWPRKVSRKVTIIPIPIVSFYWLIFLQLDCSKKPVKKFQLCQHFINSLKINLATFFTF